MSTAFLQAISQESTRLVCPMPRPTVWKLETTAIALDFKCLQTLTANNNCCKSRLSRAISLTCFN